MSRGQRARTPAQFPRMKHRAAGRLAKKRKGRTLIGVTGNPAEWVDISRFLIGGGMKMVIPDE